jgi:hypothetical protein
MDVTAGRRADERTDCRRRANMLAARIRHLAEPYRENTISWMEKCTARSLTDLDRDLALFLSELGAVERELYVSNLQVILDDALRYFGRPMSG